MTDNKKELRNAIKVDVPPPFPNFKYPEISDCEDKKIYYPPRKNLQIR